MSVLAGLYSSGWLEATPREVLKPGAVPKTLTHPVVSPGPVLFKGQGRELV